MTPALQFGQSAGPHRWRILVAAPPAGGEYRLAVMRAWLDETCGAGGWSAAPADPGGRAAGVIAFHFATPDAAKAFINRFCCGYKAAGIGS